MTQNQLGRTIRAMRETKQMLENLELRYGRRPEHLQTDEDRRLIDDYRKHVAKLTAMLDAF